MTIDVCCVVNTEYLKHYAVLLASISHNNPDLPLRHNLIYDHLEGEELAKFQRFCAGRQIEINLIKARSEDICRVYAADRKTHVTQHTWYRLLIPELLPKARVALYLDVDLVVIGSLGSLVAVDLEGFGAGVVRGYGRNFLEPFGVLPEAYFNAGVMLMNLQYWRQHRIAEKTLRFAAEHPDVLHAHDQCALNYAMRSQVKYLDPRWNVTPGAAKRHASPNPTIIHYAGRSKPWDRPWRLPYGIYYANYSQVTPWPIDYFSGERFDRSIPGTLYRSFSNALPRAQKKLRKLISVR